MTAHKKHLLLLTFLCVAAVIVAGLFVLRERASALPEGLTLTITAADANGEQDVPVSVFHAGGAMDYDRVPSVACSGSVTLRFLLESEDGTPPSSLTIGEDYYEQIGPDAVQVVQTTYPLEADKDNAFTLSILHRHPDVPEEAIYTLLLGDTRYVFRLLWQT